MKAKKQTLRQFFVNGGKGTNAQIAKALGRSEGSIRGGVSKLRHHPTNPLALVKGFTAVTDRYTVYELLPSFKVRDGCHTLKGRPALPTTRTRVF